MTGGYKMFFYKEIFLSMVNIPPGLTNSRKNFCCNPVLEGFGRFKLATQDERVEAGFVDNNSFTFIV